MLGWLRPRSERDRVPTAVCIFVLTCNFVGTARAQEPGVPDRRLGVRTAPMLLLTRTDVQVDIGLSDEHARSLARVVSDLHARASAIRGKPDAEVLAERRAIDEAQRLWLETHLSEEQRGRLLQIDLQWEGPSAVLTRPWVADWIDLSPAQRRELAKQIARHRGERDRQGTAEAAPDERPLAERVLAELSPEQRSRWRMLMGRPLVFREDAARAGTLRPGHGSRP
jgi:hypothetical protein